MTAPLYATSIWLHFMTVFPRNNLVRTSVNRAH